MNIQTPITAENSRAVVGDNKPPFEMDLALLPGHLERQTIQHAQRRDELLASFARAPEKIEDEETAKKMADLGKALRTFAGPNGVLESERKIINEPFNQGVAIVDGFYKTTLGGKVLAALTTLKARYDDYSARKEAAERRAREAAAQKAREEEEAARMLAEIAESTSNAAAAKTSHEIADEKATVAHEADKAAAAKPAELARVRSDLGTVASRTARWTGEVTDRQKVDVAKLLPYLTLDDLNKAARAAAKAGIRPIKNPDGSEEQPIAGVKIYESKSTSFR